jgi:hypothetical protein
MTLKALAHEIALLWAAGVIFHAKRLTQPGATFEERKALMSQRVKLKLSKDWFDQLVVERMELEKERQKAEEKA